MKAKSTYLLWEPEHLFIIELTEDLLRGCWEAAGTWHCAQPLMILRKSQNSCLYNVFHQRAEDIERTCDVQVKSPRRFIVPVTSNLYQMVSYDPITIIVECTHRVDPIREVAQHHYTLNLTTECPRAFTEEHIFLYQQNVLSNDAILIMQLSPSMSKWVEGLLSNA